MTEYRHYKLEHLGFATISLECLNDDMYHIHILMRGSQKKLNFLMNSEDLKLGQIDLMSKNNTLRILDANSLIKETFMTKQMILQSAKYLLVTNMVERNTTVGRKAALLINNQLIDQKARAKFQRDDITDHYQELLQDTNIIQVLIADDIDVQVLDLRIQRICGTPFVNKLVTDSKEHVFQKSCLIKGMMCLSTVTYYKLMGM